MSSFINPIPLNLAPRTKITSPYGYRILRGVRQFHKGIDIAPASVVNNQPCLAIADGKVTYSKLSRSAGNFVCILHPNGFSSRYLHMTSRNVKVGETVKKGQVVGKMGNTGRSLGAHLHFDLWVGSWPNGKNVNPMEYIPDIWKEEQKLMAVFKDIAKHWAKNDIEKAADRGIIGGRPDGTYGPNDPVTRAELAVIANRIVDRTEELLKNIRSG